MQFSIETAESGFEALDMIKKNGPYAVIVSDFRMPKMDGIKFLTQAMDMTPETVRMMLTGNADLPTAIEAINTGQIFRFLSKPCTGVQLTQALEAGIRQHQLIISEKELLENTLKESINMLIEVLAIVNPKAYGRALRTQQLVAHVVRALKLQDGWQYETAASLSQLGWIIFPPEMLDKIENNQSLSAPEALLFAEHPFAASKLLKRIPRLEKVTHMIVGQDRSIDDLCLDPAYPEAYEVDLGSHILKVCLDYDELLLKGLRHHEVIERMKQRRNLYQPEVLAAISGLQSYTPPVRMTVIDEISLRELEDGMLLVEPIRNVRGVVLVKPDTRITRTILMQLIGYHSHKEALQEPIKVARELR